MKGDEAMKKLVKAITKERKNVVLYGEKNGAFKCCNS